MTRPRDILFLSHGAPSLLTGRSVARDFLTALGARLPAPRAYAVVSAHREQNPLSVSAGAQPPTIHDFSGFGPELERFIWPAKGDPQLAQDIANRLDAAGLAARADGEAGLDHGVWVPLAVMKPRPDAPVIQISLPARGSDDAESAALGAALAPLAAEDVQLVFSGSLTHSLRDALRAPEDAPVLAEAEAFAAWARPHLTAADGAALTRWREAPQAARNHPTPEHFRPLIAALAAAGSGGAQLHESWTHGALAMDVWAFPSQA
ncbi:MAG: dioxygenase [Maricaulaceae bacterium]|nr:dioxygenase [Maricaulaceae bacterium]